MINTHVQKNFAEIVSKSRRDTSQIAAITRTTSECETLLAKISGKRSEARKAIRVRLPHASEECLSIPHNVQ
jgi:hypothetical protein